MKVWLIFSLFLLAATNVVAASKKVDVYATTQQYHDVKPGESLSQICQRYFPANRSRQLNCQQQLVEQNPDAFINQLPDRLLAGKRLWLPGSYRPVSRVDNDRYHVQQFSWGQIKTPK